MRGNPIFPLQLDGYRLRPAAWAGLAALVFAVSLLAAIHLLELKFLVSFLAGMSVLFAAAASGRMEKILFILFFTMVPLNADIHWHPVTISHAAFQELGISTLDILLMGLYFFWFTRLLASRAFTVFWPSGGTILVFLIVWSALSIFNAREPLLGFFSLASLLKAFLYFFYAANHIRTKDDLWLAARCLMAGLVLESLIGMAQYVNGGNLGLKALGERSTEKEAFLSGGTVYRIGGTLGHPNHFGGYLASVLPLALALSVTRLTLAARPLILTALAFGSTVLILTLSRSAWLMTAAACFLLVVLLFRFGYIRFRLGRIVLTFLVFGSIVAFFFPLIHDRWTADDQGSFSSRIAQTKMAWSMIQTHPFLGVGLNNYEMTEHLHEPYAPYDPRRHVVRFNRIHNIFLLVAAESGIPALLFFLLFLWTVFRRGWRKVRTTPDELMRLIFLGVLLSLFGRLIHDAVHTGFLGANILLWIYSGLLVARPKEEVTP